ncbi:MAG: SDR family NAD(P)-dependent oxidoreductase, partial [Catalinimonas sp.]
MHNKTIIVTGGSSGIGRACAAAFGRDGGRIIITGRNQARLHEAAEYLRRHVADVLPVVADVSREDDCRRVVNMAVAAGGGIDVLINNAGISMRAL